MRYLLRDVLRSTFVQYWRALIIPPTPIISLGRPWLNTHANHTRAAWKNSFLLEKKILSLGINYYFLAKSLSLVRTLSLHTHKPHPLGEIVISWREEIIISWKKIFYLGEIIVFWKNDYLLAELCLNTHAQTRSSWKNPTVLPSSCKGLAHTCHCW